MKYHSDDGDSCVGKEEGGKWPKPTLICIVGIWDGLELLPNLLSSAAIFPGLVFLRSYLPAPGSFKSAGLSATGDVGWFGWGVSRDITRVTS